MTPEQERDLEPFIDAFAELLLAEDRRRAAEAESEHQPSEEERP